MCRAGRGRAYLAEVTLCLQQLLLPGGRVGQELAPPLHEGGMAGLDGLGLNVLGGQQLIFEGSDVGDALLLEGLKASIKGFLEGAAKRQVQGPHGNERDETALHSVPQLGWQPQVPNFPDTGSYLATFLHLLRPQVLWQLLLIPACSLGLMHKADSPH